MRSSGTRVMAAVLAAGVVLALAGGPGGATVAAKKKKIKACALLTVDEVDAVVAGEPVSNPTPSKSGPASVCDYDIGEGLGSPGGGLVTVQVYTGTVGKSILGAAKTGEAVGSVYWDPTGAIATGAKKGTVVAASVSVMGTRGADHRDESVALVDAALANL